MFRGKTALVSLGMLSWSPEIVVPDFKINNAYLDATNGINDSALDWNSTLERAVSMGRHHTLKDKMDDASKEEKKVSKKRLAAAHKRLRKQDKVRKEQEQWDRSKRAKKNDDEQRNEEDSSEE